MFKDDQVANNSSLCDFIKSNGHCFIFANLKNRCLLDILYISLTLHYIHKHSKYVHPIWTWL